MMRAKERGFHLRRWALGFLGCVYAVLAAAQVTQGVKDHDPLWVALQCEKVATNSLERNQCLAERAAPGTPQQKVALGWHLLLGVAAPGADSRERRAAQALELFEEAAKLNYPPAYEGLAVGYSHRDLARSVAWREKAARSGWVQEAKEAQRRTGPPPVLAATYHLISCHPAALQPRALLRPDDDEAGLREAASTGLASLRVRQAPALEEAQARFGACNADESYYLQSLSAGERQQARDGLTQALAHVRRVRQRFPELELMAWPAAESLRP